MNVLLTEQWSRLFRVISFRGPVQSVLLLNAGEYCLQGDSDGHLNTHRGTCSTYECKKKHSSFPPFSSSCTHIYMCIFLSHALFKIQKCDFSPPPLPPPLTHKKHIKKHTHTNIPLHTLHTHFIADISTEISAHALTWSGERTRMILRPCHMSMSSTTQYLVPF